MSSSTPFSARTLNALPNRLQQLPPDLPVGAVVAGWCRREGLSGVTEDTLGKDAYAAVRAAHPDAKAPASEQLPTELPTATPTPGPTKGAITVTILPTKVWVENDFLGGRHVMLQHEGLEPFTYASFFYNWRYTSNSSTWDAACQLALSLGADEPVESRMRPLDLSPAFQAASWLQDAWLRVEGAVRKVLWRKKAQKAQS